jgi:Domain of Unknown Function (DUF1259)
LKGVSNQAEGTFKVSKPRNDVAITVEQVRIAPFMGLTSWATFAPGMKDQVMVMGDMVLFEDEVNPVMSVALDKGLEVTALHPIINFPECETRSQKHLPGGPRTNGNHADRLM